MRKYSHQAILNLENTIDDRKKALYHHLQEKHQESSPSFIQHNKAKPDDLQESLGKMNERSQLYIFAHSSRTNSDKVYSLSSSEKGSTLTTWTYIELADMLAKNLTAQDEKAGKKQNLFSNHLKISLIVYYGGKPHNQSALNSFAAKLQRELAT